MAIDDIASARVGRRSILRGGAGVLGAAGLFLAACQTSAPPAVSLATASSKLTEVLNRKKLIVGTGTGNPPWHYTDASGALLGFDIEMAKLVTTGLFGNPDAVEFVQETPANRIANLLTDKVDVVFQFMTVFAARAQQVEFTIPYYREGNGLMMSANGKYKSYNDLKAAGSAVKVAALQNAGVDTIVHTALPSAQVLQLDTSANAIQAIDSNQADATMANISAIRWLLLQSPGKYVDSGFGWLPQTYAAGVKPGDPIWLNWLNSTLHEAMTGVTFGAYSGAFSKFFGQTLPQPTLGFPLEFAPRSGQ